MRVLIFASLLACVSGVVSWEFTQLDERIGEPRSVYIDSESNVYVISVHPNSTSWWRLFKLDSEKNILLEVDVVDSIINIFLNSYDDFYLTTWINEGFMQVHTIRAGTLNWEMIATIDYLTRVYMDNDGNLIYDAEYYGVYFLKYNTTKAVRVKYLDGFEWNGAALTDKIGNTYLEGHTGINNSNIILEDQIVVISAESKENTPEGFVAIACSPIKDFRFEITGNNELLIGITDGVDGTVQKYSNKTLTTLLSDKGYYFLKGNDKITLIVSCDSAASRCRFLYLTLDGEIVQISNLQNVTRDTLTIKNAFNEAGDVYISDMEKIDQSSLEFLNHTATETIPIYFNATVEIQIRDIFLDGNENLWILTIDNGIFYLENGSIHPEQVPGSEELAASAISVDKRTNEVFVLSKNGLFVITK